MRLAVETWTALRALTPLGRGSPDAPEPGALAWYPVVGLGIGALAALVARLVPSAGAVAGVGVLELLGGGRPAPRGVPVALVTLALELGAAYALPAAARPAAFLLAPMLGRWALVVQSYGGAPARGISEAGFREFGVASTTAFAVTLALGQAIGLVLLVVAALETVALRVVIYRRLGTLTPAALGTTGAAVEAGVLLALALLLGRG
jgi:cobalamin synthase